MVIEGKKFVVVVIQNIHTKKTKEGIEVIYQAHCVNQFMNDNPIYTNTARFTRDNTCIVFYVRNDIAFQPSIAMLKPLAVEYFELSKDWYEWEFAR